MYVIRFQINKYDILNCFCFSKELRTLTFSLEILLAGSFIEQLCQHLIFNPIPGIIVFRHVQYEKIKNKLRMSGQKFCFAQKSVLFLNLSDKLIPLNRWYAVFEHVNGTRFLIYDLHSSYVVCVHYFFVWILIDKDICIHSLLYFLYI